MTRAEIDAGAGARTVDEHRAEVRALLAPILERAASGDPEFVDVGNPLTLGRVTAEATRAVIPLPPFDNSQMDGYAVRAADLSEASPERPTVLPLGPTTAAGDPPLEHRPGTASPIMTGAAIPAGADAVVPVEQTLPPEFPRLFRAIEAVEAASMGERAFTAPVVEGVFVRRRGSDLPEGSPIVEAGLRLTPARIGALASAGVREVAVRRRVRVLLCSTGDELGRGGPVEAAAGPLPAGLIHDANGPMLAAALRGVGAEVRAVRTGDSADEMLAAFASEAGWADIVVTSGGISAGAYEVVRDALEDRGIGFHRLAMQPGGPQGLGTVRFDKLSDRGAQGDQGDALGGTPVLCFPGNPVSAMLSAELFLLPQLRASAGRAPEPPREERRLAHGADSPADKLQLRRGRIADDGRVVLSGPSSHLIAGLATAEVIAEIPVGVAALPENAPITVWSFND